MSQDVEQAADTTEVTARVRERYAAAARTVQAGGIGCCGPAEAFGADTSSGNYTAQDVAGLPEEAVLASLGCGNPTALIDLRAGETVLDLGAGGGIDALLSARRVGPSGFVYGLDMTDEMLALVQEYKAKAGVTNVAFLKGRIEEIPLPANTVVVVISNCVINLPADKGQVLRGPSVCCVQAGASPFRMWWQTVQCPRRCDARWRPGLAAWPVRSKSRPTNNY
ncbi:MAG TPA: methyltransferase domain-containing protein [Ktedonobacterales bacterium]|nr:methyltransferase domain-containing protein [Ktedonobacterales bacterium]